MDGYFHGPIKIMVLPLWMRPTSMLWKNWVEESGADFCVKQAMLSLPFRVSSPGCCSSHSSHQFQWIQWIYFTIV